MSRVNYPIGGPGPFLILTLSRETHFFFFKEREARPYLLSETKKRSFSSLSLSFISSASQALFGFLAQFVLEKKSYMHEVLNKAYL